jgi:Family of unknown function (DUF6328)
MKLQQALKTSLDELRMQMLGAQVLFGFQFQGLFQDNFAALPPVGRIVDAMGLGLMVLALALMVAVPCQHRIVEEGETTPRIYQTSMRYAQLALLPVAVAISCDVFVAMLAPHGTWLATVFSIGSAALALLAWYVLAFGLRRRWSSHGKGAPMQREKTPPHVKIEQMLTEARVVLPGAQALLGFQLIVMMTRRFTQLPAEVQLVHLAALGGLLVAIVLLISPAAIHRIAFGGQDDPRMHSSGSMLISIALLPLAIAVSCDLWVALTVLFSESAVALGGALAAFALLMALWFGLPLLLQRHYASATELRAGRLEE